MMFFGCRNIHHDDEYGECSRCGKELYRYDEAYEIDGKMVCMDCVTEEEAAYYYARTMGDHLEDDYNIYMEEQYESLLQGY